MSREQGFGVQGSGGGGQESDESGGTNRESRHVVAETAGVAVVKASAYARGYGKKKWRGTAAGSRDSVALQDALSARTARVG